MCERCIAQWKKEHAEALAAANEHMDSIGVPEDSIVRGLANIEMACSANPLLHVLMHEMYRNPEQLVG